MTKARETRTFYLRLEIGLARRVLASAHDNQVTVNGQIEAILGDWYAKGAVTSPLTANPLPASVDDALTGAAGGASVKEGADGDSTV